MSLQWTKSGDAWTAKSRNETVGYRIYDISYRDNSGNVTALQVTTYCACCERNMGKSYTCGSLSEAQAWCEEYEATQPVIKVVRE